MSNQTRTRAGTKELEAQELDLVQVVMETQDSPLKAVPAVDDKFLLAAMESEIEAQDQPQEVMEVKAVLVVKDKLELAPVVMEAKDSPIQAVPMALSKIQLEIEELDLPQEAMEVKAALVVKDKLILVQEVMEARDSPL